MAVYTEVEDDALRAFLSEYNIGELLSAKGIAEGVENSNYLLHSGAGYYILTLYEKRVAEEDLPYFLGLMEHLAQKGLTCPLPVKARDGSALKTLCGRPAAIISFLEGMWVKRPRVEHCGEVGAALGAMHLAGQDFAGFRKNALSLEDWKPLFQLSADRADTVEPGLRAMIEQELTDLEAVWPKDLPSGVVHADLFPDNVFFLSNRLSGLIDFYFACNDLLAYDIAICLNAWCFESDLSFNVTKAKAFLRGYESKRMLENSEREALPTLARGAALRFLLTRLHDWLSVPPGALVTPKDPLEYRRKLRFHQLVDGPADYGLAE